MVRLNSLFCRMLTAVCLMLVSTGCRLMDQRSKQRVEDKVETSSSARSPQDAVMLDELKSDAFAAGHSPGRSPATWSSEAQEIESHFNVR
jgi:hypothetical protein